MKIVYVDDMGTTSDIREVTSRELKRLNKYLEMMALEEYGRWYKLSDVLKQKKGDNIS